jgi:hypothetical protein
MEEDNSAYKEIKKLRRINLKLLFIISDILAYIDDEKDLMHLTEKIEKIKSIE